MEKRRCAWATSDSLSLHYHDNEWGRPLYDEKKLFELLILEGMQSGLSWLTILKKRKALRLAFDYFEPEKIALYDSLKVEALLNDSNIIRNKLKIQATINNACAFLNVKNQHGNFSEYLWQFVEGKPQQHHWKSLVEIPSQTDCSKRMSNQLKKDGFKFVGPTICYAFMQATGMVNDHTTDCFLYSLFK